MTDVMDTLFLEQTRSEQQNFTTVQKFEQMYIMIQFTAAMMATTVGTLLVIGLALMLGYVKSEEQKKLNHVKNKGKQTKKGGIVSTNVSTIVSTDEP